MAQEIEFIQQSNDTGRIDVVYKDKTYTINKFKMHDYFQGKNIYNPSALQILNYAIEESQVIEFETI